MNEDPNSLSPRLASLKVGAVYLSLNEYVVMVVFESFMHDRYKDYHSFSHGGIWLAGWQNCNGNIVYNGREYLSYCVWKSPVYQ